MTAVIAIVVATFVVITVMLALRSIYETRKPSL